MDNLSSTDCAYQTEGFLLVTKQGTPHGLNTTHNKKISYCSLSSNTLRAAEGFEVWRGYRTNG